MSEPRSLPLAGTVPFEEYAPLYLNIRTKSNRVVPFVPNGPQRRLLNKIREIKAEGRPVRLLILKARQLGFSTLSLGLMYEYTTGVDGMGAEAFLAAHDDDSTEDLFERVRLMHDLAPEKPLTRYSNRRELDFSNPDMKTRREDPGMLSKIRIGTAGKVNLGRSKTLSYVHCSEVAFWANASRVLLSLEQAIPDGANTIEIIESTANGVGGEFYNRWKRAKNPDTAGDWVAIFFPWHEEPEYSRELVNGRFEPVPESVVDIAEFEKEEAELKAMYTLTDQQLNWRRWAITNKCGAKIELFRQEYPSSDVEAFLTSGRPVFNQQLLMYRRRALEAEDLRRRANGEATRWIRGRLSSSKGTISLQPTESGELFVYKVPDTASRYVLGGDVAEGVSKGDDPDASTISVFDRFSGVQVAAWWGRLPAIEFAAILMRLGYWYNTGLIACESNNHGHTVVTECQQKNYPNLYIRQDFDKPGMELIEKYGWETNKKTRPLLVDALDTGINTRQIHLSDIPTIDECLTFVRNPKNGKPEGDVDCHDDRVLGTGIAVAVLDWGPPVDNPSSKFDALSKIDPMAAMASQDVQRRIMGLLREQDMRNG